MLIGERLRAFREAKGLSQGDIENRTGLLRPYVSRVENDHTTPAIETLEKWARALGIPLYALFYENKIGAKATAIPKALQLGKTPKDARFIEKLLQALPRMQERDRRLLLHAAMRLAARKKSIRN